MTIGEKAWFKHLSVAKETCFFLPERLKGKPPLARGELGRPT